ncbi:hypothetical protein VN12_26140 [Pirellula sp. SH-Sr6A]|uniref:hypothetical protein n=1 Tax=Pirellula sp. SH-Sr6A TaxID=1632865 RepID=UPI00078DA03B|nr:hypothetical protein [Pirellula sp. SH-Sr6A]AMV35600.1 hypothetical protein VN12_26140 [Pirellula sp. SH-Sr6A]
MSLDLDLEHHVQSLLVSRDALSRTAFERRAAFTSIRNEATMTSKSAFSRPVVSVLSFVLLTQFTTPIYAGENEGWSGKSMQKVAELPEYKLGAVVEQGDVQFEVTLMARDTKWLIKSKQTKFEDTPDSDIAKKLIAHHGVDPTVTIIYDGTNLIYHYPVKYLVTIDEYPKPTVSERYQALFPNSWNSFYIKSSSEKLKLSYLIDLESPQKTISPASDQSRVRITEVSLSEKPIAFKTRYIEVEKSTSLVSKSHMGGGSGLPVTKEYSWANRDGRWYPRTGKVTVGDQPSITWTINSFSHDVKDISCKFSLDDLSLPEGTRIADDPLKKKGLTMNRYVGGEQGRIEHLLKRDEAQIIIDKATAK